MSTLVVFDVPRGIETEFVARTLNAYLVGGRLHKNEQQGRLGPYTMNDDPNCWQLEDMNDYWLHIKNGQARVSCRYFGRQEQVLELIVQLFKLQYDRR